MASHNINDRALVPVRPILSAKHFRKHDTICDIPSILDSKDFIWLSSARTAIALALKHLGISRGDSVMIPAYHCTAMIEPVVWIGAKPIFFQIQPDTSANIADLDRKIDKSTRAIMAVHYFGFPQNIEEVRRFCDQNNLFLIEDCAHSFFGESNGSAIGTWGDYSVSSTIKFFPSYEGGILASSKQTLDKSHILPSPLAYQFKSLINMLEISIQHNRLKALKPFLKIKDYVWRKVKENQENFHKGLIAPPAAYGSYHFDPFWADKKISFISRKIVQTAAKSRVIAKRRKNFESFLTELSEVRGGVPLFKSLPEKVVPYVFPFYVESPEKVFVAMKNAGIPIIRFGEQLWRGVDFSVCKVSYDYSKKIFQFPCHQDLEEKEVESMIGKIKKILKENSQ